MFYEIKNKNQGTAALEALLSIWLMLIFFYVAWGAAVFIFNKSRIDFAAQMSAHTAIMTMDRESYRGINPDNKALDALKSSAVVSASVFRENTCGLLPDGFAGKPITSCGVDFPRSSIDSLTLAGLAPGDKINIAPDTSLEVQCMSSKNQIDVYTSVSPAETSKCITGGFIDNTDRSDYMFAKVTSGIDIPFALLKPAQGLKADKDQHAGANVESIGKAYSIRQKESSTP